MQRIALSKDLELSQIIYGMWRLGDDQDTSTAAVQAKIEVFRTRDNITGSSRHLWWLCC
jgi:predicted oxidoreductase